MSPRKPSVYSPVFEKASASLQAPPLPFLVTLILPFCLLWKALDLRLPQMTRLFWGDEYHQFYVILHANGLMDLRRQMTDQLQPILDYALRKLFWFPVFGQDELFLRIPSLFYSLVSVLLSFSGSRAVLAKFDFGKNLALFIAFLVAAYTATQNLEVYYAAEARMYSFASLMSLAWCFYVFAGDLKKPGWLFAISLVFTNIHFFALPQVIALYGFLILKEIARKRPFKPGLAAKYAASLVGVVALTILINQPAWDALSQSPPGTTRVPLKEAFLNTWPLIRDYFHYLHLPIPVLALLPIVAAGFYKSRALAKTPVIALLFLIFCLMPAFFFHTRCHTEHPYFDRYFMPFFGYGPSLLLISALSIQEILAPISLPKDLGRLLAATSVALLLILFKIPGNLETHVLSRLHGLSANFSPYYSFYRRVDAIDKPVLLIQNFYMETPTYYFQFLLKRPERLVQQPLKLEILGERHNEATRAGIRKFLTDYPESLVVIGGYEGTLCPSHYDEPAVQDSLRVERVYSPGVCAWAISGARSLDEIEKTAKTVNFSI